VWMYPGAPLAADLPGLPPPQVSQQARDRTGRNSWVLRVCVAVLLDLWKRATGTGGTTGSSGSEGGRGRRRGWGRGVESCCSGTDHLEGPIVLEDLVQEEPEEPFRVPWGCTLRRPGAAPAPLLLSPRGPFPLFPPHALHAPGRQAIGRSTAGQWQVKHRSAAGG